jgi:hypothetical protein
LSPDNIPDGAAKFRSAKVTADLVVSESSMILLESPRFQDHIYACLDEAFKVGKELIAPLLAPAKGIIDILDLVSEVLPVLNPIPHSGRCWLDEGKEIS